MMSEEDKQTFKAGRPYVVGVIALITVLVSKGGISDDKCFDAAEEFVKTFERRNGISKKAE